MWIQIYALLFLHKILQLNQCGVLISNMGILFSNYSQNYPNKSFLVLNLGISIFFTKFFFTIFYFCTKLCSKTNSRTQISNMTMVFSISTPKIRISDMFGPKFKDFYFVSNAAIRQIQGHWSQIWQWFFRITVWKYPSKAVFVLNVSIFFIFAWIFTYWKIQGYLFQKLVFFKSQGKIRKYKLLFENFDCVLNTSLVLTIKWHTL